MCALLWRNREVNIHTHTHYTEIKHARAATSALIFTCSSRARARWESYDDASVSMSESVSAVCTNCQQPVSAPRVAISYVSCDLNNNREIMQRATVARSAIHMCESTPTSMMPMMATATATATTGRVSVPVCQSATVRTRTHTVRTVGAVPASVSCSSSNSASNLAYPRAHTSSARSVPFARPSRRRRRCHRVSRERSVLIVC